MAAVHIGVLSTEPAGGGVDEAGSVQRAEPSADAVAVELPPALVEDRPVADAGVVFQLVHRVGRAAAEGIAASFIQVKTPVVPFLNADGGKHGVPEITVAAVVDHVLPDDHAQPVALIVEFLRLDFDVLAQGVEAETLHGEDIIGIAFRGGGGEQPLRPVALIQQTVEEPGLAVETQAGVFAHLFDFQRTDGKVGFHLILRRFHSEAVKIGGVRAPEMGIFRGDGHLPVFQRELPQLLHADGSVQGAAALSSLGIPTVTIPGTIDNDMHGTDETIGHDTAVNAVGGAVSRIRDTASAHDRAAIIEVMGRFAGNIALDAGIACGAEYILVPEVPFSREKLARSLIGQMKEGRTNSIIICAEGADDGRALGDWLKERTNIDICTTILGFIQRGGRPSARDSILGSLLGAAAVKALLDGQITSLIGMNKGEIRILPYSEAAKEKKIFKKGLYTLAGILGAAQEDEDIAESGL